jgi:hypothetical protein
MATASFESRQLFAASLALSFYPTHAVHFVCFERYKMQSTVSLHQIIVCVLIPCLALSYTSHTPQ